MATTEQIARAKARVALARLSGKQLPAEVLERAALNYSAAEDEAQPDVQATKQVADQVTEPTVTVVTTSTHHEADKDEEVIDAEIVDLDEMPPPGDPRRTPWLHERLGVNELPMIDTVLDVTRAFTRKPPRRKTSFIHGDVADGTRYSTPYETRTRTDAVDHYWRNLHGTLPRVPDVTWEITPSGVKWTAPVGDKRRDDEPNPRKRSERPETKVIYVVIDGEKHPLSEEAMNAIWADFPVDRMRQD